MLKKAMKKYKDLPVQVRASLWFFVCSFLQKGISMVTTPIFTRLLTPSEYGQFGAFNSWYGIITIIIGLSLTSGVHIQGVVKFSEEREKFTSSLQGLTTVLLLFWSVIYFVFREQWNKIFDLSTIQMLAMLIMVWTTSVFNFWANEKRVEYKYRVLVGITIIALLAKPFIGIFLVTHSDDKVTARVLGLVLVELACYTWMYFYQLKRGKAFFSKEYWLYAIGFNLPLVPHYLSQTVLNSADRIMIQKMIGDTESGIYNLAYSVSMIMTLFNTALSQTISPWVYQKIKSHRTADVAPVAYSTLTLIAIVNLVLIILAPEVVAMFAPKLYYDAIWVVPPVAMSVFFLYCYDLFAKIAFYYEKTKFIMIASVLGAFLNIVLNYIFINMFGYVAAGYTTLVCYMVYCAFHYLFMRRVCRQCNNSIYPFETTKLMLITLPFIITGICILLTYKFPIVRYGVLIVACVLMLTFRKRVVVGIRKLYSLKNST